MERKYRGYDAEKNKWEEFSWDLKEEPTLEETGYDKIEKL